MDRLTDTAGPHDLSHLPPAAARLGAAAAHPRAVAVLCIIVMTGLGWLYLGVVAGSAIAQGGDFVSLVRALCRPLVESSFGMPAGTGLRDTSLLLAMWSAMSLAMMLPSAAPMILTYAEIADTAAAKGEPVVSPFALALGYAAVWIAFALAATLLQNVLARFALLDTAMAPASRTVSAMLFVIAGLYQFSALKQACLRACQRPFPFFFANWKTTSSEVFALGMRQGLHCLGCCWAMMLLMFAVGVMNVLWMAGLAIAMTVEKLAATPRISRGLGAVLLGIGALLYGMQGLSLLNVY